MCTEIEDKLVTALALVYKQIPWGKMRTRHNPWDIFNHRVRSASCRKTIGEAFSRLANYFGLQSLPAQAVPIILELRQCEREALDKMYREHVLISMMAIMRAKEMKTGQYSLFSTKEVKSDGKDV